MALKNTNACIIKTFFKLNTRFFLSKSRTLRYTKLVFLVQQHYFYITGKRQCAYSQITFEIKKRVLPAFDYFLLGSECYYILEIIEKYFIVMEDERMTLNSSLNIIFGKKEIFS